MQRCYGSSVSVEQRSVWVQCAASGEELSASGTLLEKRMKTLATYHCLLSPHFETITILKQLPTLSEASETICEWGQMTHNWELYVMPQ